MSGLVRVVGFLVMVLRLVMGGVLVAEGVVILVVSVLVVLGLVVNVLVELMLVLVVRDHGVVLVVDGTGVSLVLKLDVGLFLVVLLVVRVEVSGVIDNGSVLVNDVGIIVVLVMGHALNEVMGLLMFVVLVLVMV